MTHLAARLADEDRRLAFLTAGDLSVERTLASAYAMLSTPARDALRRLADVDPELVEHGLAELRDGHCHYSPLVRLYARSLARAAS